MARRAASWSRGARGSGDGSGESAFASVRVALSYSVMRKSSSSSTLAQLLRADLGRRDPGERLPSVRALMRRHQVSPVTIRQAVAQLASEGLVEARPGHGTFVAHRPAPPGDADLSWQTLALGSGRISVEAVAALLLLPGPGTINLAGGYPAADLQ